MKSKPKTYEEALKRVEAGERFEDYETLSLADENYWTIAHEQAKHGWTTEDKKVLALSDIEETRVAHLQAYWGWTTDDDEILGWKDCDGWTVANEITYHKHHVSSEGEDVQAEPTSDDLNSYEALSDSERGSVRDRQPPLPFPPINRDLRERRRLIQGEGRSLYPSLCYSP